MTLKDISDRLDLTVCCAGGGLDRQLTGGYSGDLLSDVMAHSGQGQAWVTIQVHINIVAVAVLKEHAAIIIANGRTPAAETVRKAEEENVPIFTSTRSAFEICGMLHALGVSGVT
jgi:predicted transcriptional regulator